MQCEEAAIRDQLLQEFVPDDLCSLGGGQMYTDAPEEARESSVRGLDKVRSLPVGIHSLG